MHPNLAQLTEYFLVEKIQGVTNTLRIKISFTSPPCFHCASGVLNSRQLRRGVVGNSEVIGESEHANQVPKPLCFGF